MKLKFETLEVGIVDTIKWRLCGKSKEGAPLDAYKNQLQGLLANDRRPGKETLVTIVFVYKP